MRTVHPRIRGERIQPALDRPDLTGSSPHTRGTCPSGGPPPGRKRFIPAYAGNVSGRARRASTGTVHPRIRGERWAISKNISQSTGSSPHTRGTCHNVFDAPTQRRFIPAYAGNVRACWFRHRRIAVHPRIRGERRGAPPEGVPPPGSSPHTRGTLDDAQFHFLTSRFIPAYAGNVSA